MTLGSKTLRGKEQRLHKSTGQRLKANLTDEVMEPSFLAEFWSPLSLLRGIYSNATFFQQTPASVVSDTKITTKMI